MKLHTTSNYKLLKESNMNRADRAKIISSGKFQNLKRTLKEFGQLEPITVSSDMVIINGQTRFDALKMLGMPIKYIVLSIPFSKAKSMMLESGLSKKWTALDVANFWAQQGSSPYKKIIKISKELNVNISFMGNITKISEGIPISIADYDFLHGNQQDFDYDTFMKYYKPISVLIHHKSFGRVRRQVINSFVYAVDKVGFDKAEKLFSVISGNSSKQTAKVTRDSVVAKLTTLGKRSKHSIDFPSSLSAK